MSEWLRKQGDIGDTIDVEIFGVIDLSTVASVVAHVWRRGVTAVSLSAAVTNIADRIVTVQLGGAAGWLPSAQVGEWNHELQFTFLNGDVITWPSGAPDTIKVGKQGG